MIEPVKVGRHGNRRWRYDGRSGRLAGCMTFTLSKQAEPEQDVGLCCKLEDPPPVTHFLQTTFPNTTTIWGPGAQMYEPVGMFHV